MMNAADDDAVKNRFRGGEMSKRALVWRRRRAPPFAVHLR
jgi:hypothetical protein